ncbi:MAG: SDR family NAD(P)-dependent oxidoreductase [Legionella sp.]
MNEPIAIIGMNCQFPGIHLDIEDVGAFYEMLLQGQTSIKEVPKNRWNIDEYYDVDREKADKIIGKKGGFLNDPHLFDANFFKISSIEAKQMDPQHRLFLEVAIRALNHANITLDSLNDSNTGVFCGASTQDYGQLNYKDNIEFNAYTVLGSAASAAAGRLSHFLNLKGPSMVVDTACSSSLAALYLAVTALRNKQCSMAFVGGVHLSLCPESFIGVTKAHMLSPSDKCSSFDAHADGYVRSEGCGVILVKRLSDAIKDKNTIYAVVKSIVMNQDGNDGTLLVAPNLKAQCTLHQAVLDEANLTASDINYIETHGTGTVVGDSVEFKAIQQIHQGHHSQEKPLVIGALKSNLGHSISSSGIASLIKAVGALTHEMIPPNLHYSTPGRSIHPETIPALLPIKTTAFSKQKDKKRYVQISNFGFTGTNVSTVIEEAPEQAFNVTNSKCKEAQCFVLSAKSEYSLKQMLTNFVHYLQASTACLQDICYTLINCRDHFKFRCAIIADDKETLIKKIESEDFIWKKVERKKEIKKITHDANLIYTSYLEGDQIQLEVDNVEYTPVNLPLYYFDRQSYWHESRVNTLDLHWLNHLYLQSPEEQLGTIKAKIGEQMQILLKKDSINEHQDFDSLGLTQPLLEELDQLLYDLFAHRYKMSSSSFLTLDKLARHLHQVMMPTPVFRQPSINILNDEPIAIIGMSCRYPQAPNIDAFLSLLEQGTSGMIDIPLDRWDNEKFYDSDVNAIGRLYIKQLGLIENVRNFDAEFFNISPREAKLMSPQLRIFMEESYHALENANLPLTTIQDSNTGVFVGCGTNEYPRLLMSLGSNLDDLNIYFATGNVLNAIPGRVAYSFDFHGPIQAIDTACSSSMTAIHNACLSLQSGDCNMALAGGVNILLTPDSNITLSKARMLSPDSRCKSFSEDADGYARSEGCGVLVLKRLSDALDDKNNILAVIKGSSINSDGKTGGFTIPNGTAQEEVIRSALAKAKLVPEDIDYIEAHATGTPLGDPIEANTLMKIFAESHSKENPLYMSSVKTNIGHAESASGVASVIKAVLSLQHHKLFKHLNFKKLNPKIELVNTVIPLSTMDWSKEHNLRCAGISSFGFSGANAHIILQEAPSVKKEARTLPRQSLLVLSAKSKVSLELLLTTYQNYLTTTHYEFADIAYTAATCRDHFLFRVAIKANNTKEAAALIERKKYTIYQIKKAHKTSQRLSTLEQMQAAYELGFFVPWSDFYASLRTRFEKVTLPLYEFVHQEHWFAEKDKLKDAPLPQDWCFQLQWEHQIYDKNNRKMQGNNWLLIGARSQAAGFKELGLNIIFEDEDYSLAKLEGIIFAVALDSTSSSDIEVHFEIQKQLIKKLLDLVKKLTSQAVEPHLIVLTNNAIAELAVGELNLNNSPLVGFCKTLVLELPQFRTILIDLDKKDTPNNLGHIVDEINYNHGQNYEHMIAYREEKRWVARLKKTPLADKKFFLSGEGRYLITGGCGGLGLVTAQALLSAGARELILTARNVDKPAINDAIKKMQANYTGRIIRAISMDSTDKEKLRHLLTEINADGQLKGIIHAAGAGIKAPLLEHEDDDVDYVFSAKVKGGWYLHELSQHYDLDFFIVYSSIASVFGSNKEAVYSATNSFLDALIAERQRLELVGTSIQWGPWGEVGMAKDRSQGHSLKQALITNAQGQSFIKTLIGNELSYVTIISPEYLNFMLDFVPKPLPLFYKNLLDSLNVASMHPKDTNNLSPWLNAYLGLSPDKRIEACINMVRDLCKDILELSDLDENEGFFELGFDSLMMTEMAAKLKKMLDPSLKVAVNIGFDYPTINKLAHYIASELDTKLISNSAMHAVSKQEDDAIAIIGMSCSLPKAPDISAFEIMLEQGLNGVSDIPIERWDNSKYYDANRDAPGKSYVNKLGLIENIQCFDANFFGISPREAKLLEPQQRIFLECSYKALENANYTPDSLRGSLTGVFAGVGPNEYYAQLEKSGFSNEELSVYSITGNVLNLIPGRVAYTFDFKGPALSMDTACSSSLVAIHYACQSLKNHEIDYALAGGVNILLRPESNITLCKAKALSPEGQCKTFDEQADGYARAEGCGIVMLKRLSDALRDQDTILAVIKASSVNNDGKSAGLIVPNGKSQENVMLSALSQTDLHSSDISYIEAHGTGTPLGDPIEVNAINNVYGTQRDKGNPLYLGAVKTNIGHLESASGVVSVIKTVIALQKKKIYKHLNFHKLNPNIKLNNTRIALQTMDWYTEKKLKCAGVNAFGFSGTNAHIILQEFAGETNQQQIKQRQMQMLVLSAKSQTALDHLTKSYQHYLETTQDDFGTICFTAATCRAHYPYRLALIAECSAKASQLLATHQFASSHGEKNTLDLSSKFPFKSLLKDYLLVKNVDWTSYYKMSENKFRKVTLPNYIFDLHEFWPDKKSENKVQVDAVHPLLGQMFSMPNNEYLFTHQLDLQNLNYIKQHCVFDKVVFPGAAYIEAGLAIARIILKSNTVCLEKFIIERPLYPKQGQEFQLQVKPNNDGKYKITVFAKCDDNWQTFSEMKIHCIPLSGVPESLNLNVLKSFFNKRIDLSQVYEHFKKRSLVYGEEFQVLHEVYIKADNVLSQVVLTKATHAQDYFYHPVTLDGAMQSILLLGMNDAENTTYIPYAMARMITYQQAPRNFWVHLTRRHDANENELCIDIKMYNNTGLLIAEIEELKLRKVNRSTFISYESSMQHLYLTKWTMIRPKLSTQVELPELWVIAANEVRVRKLLGTLNYQFIPDPSKLESLENKDILFLYEQEQFNELFHFCQRMFKSRPKSFILITENAYAISEHDRVNPYHTMASSFWNSFRNELEFTRNYTIDLDANSVITAALKYIYYTNNTENKLAVRGSLYIPRLKKKKLPINLTPKEKLFSQDASYLITGGTGALAKLLIEYLIDRGVKQIVITSRSACSKDTKALIESSRLKEIVITHYEVDASNYQQMERIIEEINDRSKPLKGVFHLAGIVQDGLIVNLNDKEMNSVLNAKMESALILHQLTKHIPLNMFVLFSSSASLLGARGQANYVAANGFLDGLAHLRCEEGLPALAINWGPFNSIGMTAKLTQVMQQHGFMLLDKDNINILDVLLSSKLPQIALCPIQWELYFNYVPKQAYLSELIKNEGPQDPVFLNALRQASKEERVVLLNQTLGEIVAHILELDDINHLTTQAGLFSLGLDSLMALDIRNQIHDKLNCPSLNLSIEYFINDPTIDKISRSIVDELSTILIDVPLIQTEPAKISIPEEIAVCDFQYMFWVLNKLESSFNIGMQIQLHGKLNKDYVAQALDYVITHNTAFWINFNEEIPTQRVNKQGQFKLIYTDISLSSKTESVLKTEFQTNMRNLIPLTQQPLIRVYLYKINNDLHELHLVIPHIIVDDTSCEIVFAEFKLCYEALSLGKKLLPLPKSGSYLNYVKLNNNHYEKNLQAKIDFWQKYNKGFKMLSFGKHYHLSDAANQPKNLFHYSINTQTVKKFINWHKEKNMNVSTGLIAVCHIVFYKISQQNKIPITLIHGGRVGSLYKNVIGLFSEYKRINTVLNEEYQFIDFLNSIEDELLKTASYQSCPHLIKNKGLEGVRLSMGQYWEFISNKLFLRKQFKKTKLITKIIDYYLEYLSCMLANKKSILMKFKLNKLFNLQIPLQQPDRMRVLLSVTPSFFTKKSSEMRFANLDYSFPGHFDCVDRPIGNQTLWVYFSKNQQDEYLLSINGPLTIECKKQMGIEINSLIAKIVANERYSVADLIQ